MKNGIHWLLKNCTAGLLNFTQQRCYKDKEVLKHHHSLDSEFFPVQPSPSEQTIRKAASSPPCGFPPPHVLASHSSTQTSLHRQRAIKDGSGQQECRCGCKISRVRTKGPIQPEERFPGWALQTQCWMHHTFWSFTFKYHRLESFQFKLCGARSLCHYIIF